MQIRLVSDIASIDREAWDALAGQDDPFVEHAFLAALESSGTVGRDSGWTPMHVTVWDGDRLAGAMLLYEKEHSYGEFIFDWAWADAAMRLGIRYYPKLVSMVPVTPATGRRVLLADGVDPLRVAGALTRGIFQAAEETRSSSVHLLFLTQTERDLLLAADDRMRPRLSHQFHWHNDGYASFDDYLARFRAPMRKQVKKERRRVEESGLEVRVLEGPDLGDAEWKALRKFYVDTCASRGSPSYLTAGFFRTLRKTFAHRVVASLAYHDGRPVAGSLNFEKGAALFGRYWGCVEEHQFLHFELCYYRLIERAIERGMQRFEAGAQGIHKLRRGLLPVPIHSLCWVRDPVLARAVGDYLPREAFAVQRQIEELAEHGPFRRDER